VRKLPHTLLDVAVTPLDLAEPEEEHEPDGSLKQLQHAVHKHPVPERPIAKTTRCPVHAQEDPTRDGDQYARDAAKEHDDLNEPCSFFRVLLNDIKKRIGIVYDVVGTLEE
jgi:hypothetical protein